MLARLTAVIATGATVLAACGGTTAHRTAAQRMSARIGSPSRPQQISCAEEATQYTGPPAVARPGDLIIGPVSFPNGQRLARMKPSDYGAPSTGYKIPPVIVPGTTVTLTIAPRARSYVVFSNPWSPRGGVVSAVYHTCPRKRGFFPQGFRFTDGRIRGCVPLIVRVAGERRARHATLSLFAGSCARA